MSSEIDQKIKTILNRGKSHCWDPNKKRNCLLKLSMYPMGKDLLLTGSISSFWIDYLVNGDDATRQLSKNNKQLLLKALGHDSYIITSWQEIYKKLIRLEQEHVKENCVLASVPCGFMRDFFKLDFSKISNFRLVGVDSDQMVIDKALELSHFYRLQDKIKTYCCDALTLPFENKFSFISSYGLNIYLKTFEQQTQLYNSLFKSLKPSGVLLIHFLTLPPFLSTNSDWKIDKMNRETMLFDCFLLQSILKFPCHSFIKADKIAERLSNIGFTDIKIELDSYGVAAIVSARK
ncbi:MAG: class I SAM-dependent methyltransferase [Chlamydiales bacterium]|nr:class I SAM-dependent methyltransferase [Chlamydiales bacterium]